MGNLLLALLIIIAGAQEPPRFLRCTATGCCDKHQFCAFWSQNNECKNNPKWMLPNCQISCQVCTNNVSSQVLPPQSPQKGSLLKKCINVIAVEVEHRLVFSVAQMRARQQRLGCAEVQIPAGCKNNECFHKKFRTIDGTCNNLENPIVGAAFTPYTRLLPSFYGDGIGSMIGGRLSRRPNAREVSMFLLSTRHAIAGSANSLLAQYGQFISHDITRNAMESKCSCLTGFDRQCANILRPQSDNRVERCIPFTRSFPVCNTGVGNRSREHLNENTAYLDGSVIYSSEAVTLRTLRVGAMLRTDIVNGRPFPPNNRRDQ
ncbi:hypothetical protein KIN20_003251 [Parelaphostrongylus tenuis]|uniref:ShKT domain-containing protein n=1 Tax=Parelaphostrongylus tenuis TaxID=148309 RepID=A0AAD5QFX7_PARTN|nr:hypothetical protein KIN20_003251 [Parelaphostrongylus tenuis]